MFVLIFVLMLDGHYAPPPAMQGGGTDDAVGKSRAVLMFLDPTSNFLLIQKKFTKKWMMLWEKKPQADAS